MSTLYRGAYGLYIASLVYTAIRINHEVPEPYMDDIFHVKQAQAYCQGRWSEWDQAITTPPGLYLIPAGLAHLRKLIPEGLGGGIDPCSVASLRGFNLLILAILPLLYTSLLSSIHSESTTFDISSSADSKPSKLATKSKLSESEALRNSLKWEGLVIALMPTVSFFGYLYYTDLLSLFTLLLSYRFSLSRLYFLSSLLGGLSLICRQTNIIWIGFVLATSIIREINLLVRGRLAGVGKGVKKGGSQLYDPLLGQSRMLDLILTPYSIVYLTSTHVQTIFTTVLVHYLPLFAGFAFFLYQNGGSVVLGDKSNHVSTIHLPQIYYFIAFSAVFTSPHLLAGLLEKGKVKVLVKSLGFGGDWKRHLTTANVLVFMCWTVKNFTVAHPFLLADNRHYAFYIWRRILNPHPLARYLLTPLYLVAGKLVYNSLCQAKKMRLSTFLLYSFSTAVVLIPTPLIEPRYFLLPYIVLRLHHSPTSSLSSSSPTKFTSRQARLSLEAVLYILVSSASIWVFLNKSFEWKFEVGTDGKGVEGRDERELGKRQRFMW
ncbi:hypothetical protein JCM5353_005482 [Sporobolomyces roseus]